VTDIYGPNAQKRYYFLVLINMACWRFSAHYFAKCAGLSNGETTVMKYFNTQLLFSVTQTLTAQL
jgi:hypothetical protein